MKLGGVDFDGKKYGSWRNKSERLGMMGFGEWLGWELEDVGWWGGGGYGVMYFRG